MLLSFFYTKCFSTMMKIAFHSWFGETSCLRRKAEFEADIWGGGQKNQYSCLPSVCRRIGQWSNNNCRQALHKWAGGETDYNIWNIKVSPICFIAFYQYFLKNKSLGPHRGFLTLSFGTFGDLSRVPQWCKVLPHTDHHQFHPCPSCDAVNESIVQEAVVLL